MERKGLDRSHGLERIGPCSRHGMDLYPSRGMELR